MLSSYFQITQNYSKPMKQLNHYRSRKYGESYKNCVKSFKRSLNSSIQRTFTIGPTPKSQKNCCPMHLAVVGIAILYETAVFLVFGVSFIVKVVRAISSMTS